MPGTTGVAFSGGGIIAMLASTCQLRALLELVPNATSSELGATSGGIAGSVLMATMGSGANLSFPPSWSPASYGPDAHEVLSQRFRDASRPWFAAITDALAPLPVEEQSGAPADWWPDAVSYTHLTLPTIPLV